MKKLMTRNTLLLSVVGLAMVFALQFRPIDDFDIFWQIKLGELMLDRWELIRSDLFSYSHFGQSVPTVGWLAQIAFALIYSVSGWFGLQIIAGILLAGAFVLAGWSACSGIGRQQNQLSVFSLITAVVMGFLAALTNSSVRPQLIGLLCFAGLLHLAGGSRPFWRNLLILLSILLIWQNSHPSVLIGVFALLPGLGVKWVGYFRNLYLKFRSPNLLATSSPAMSALDTRKSASHAPPWSFTLITAVVGLSQFGTPEGFRITELSATNLLVSRDWLGSTEWLPSWAAEVRAALAVFWGELFLTLLLLCRLRFRWRWIDGLTFLTMTALALYAARFVIFWSVAMVPLWARWIEQARPSGLFAFDGQAEVGRRVFVWVAVLGSALVLLLPNLLRTLSGQSRFSEEIPLLAVSRLKSVVPAGRIYNYREYSGPLILAGFPDWQINIDGRLYLYDITDWIEYNRAADGQIPLDELVLIHQPAAFFLRPSFDRKLVELLRRSPRWRQDFCDLNAVIFLPSR